MACIVHKKKNQVFEVNHSTVCLLHWDRLLILLLVEESSMSLFYQISSPISPLYPSLLFSFICVFVMFVRCNSVKSKWKLCRKGKVKQGLVYQDLPIGGHLNNNVYNFPFGNHIPCWKIPSVNPIFQHVSKTWIKLGAEILDRIYLKVHMRM